MNIAIINESTLIDEDAAQFVASAIRQSLEEFCPHWDLRVPRVEHARPGEENTEIAEADPCVIVLLDNADQAGALGYHATTPDGKPYAAVFVADSFTNLSGAALPEKLGLQEVADFIVQVVDHEAKEAVLDPDAADMVDDGSGMLWAKEACDAVESDTFKQSLHGVLVTVSDYVLPSFFRPGSTGPWDALNKLTGPFTIAPGGYSIVEQGGQVGQKFGAEADGWRVDAHKQAFFAAADSSATASRTGWRIVAHTVRPAT